VSDLYSLLPRNICVSKSYGEYFETYDSHVDACTSFIESVMKNLNSRYEFVYIKNMVSLHDIGKRGNEFQRMIRDPKKSSQIIRHEELAFIMWLDGYQELQCLEEPQILAILSHHRTLLDEKSAIKIERYISEHENFRNLIRKWLGILKTPRTRRIDNKLLLPALHLVDLLRTIDVLASYTTQTVFCMYHHLDCADSLYDSAYTDLSRELSSINLRKDQIKFTVINEDEGNIMIQIIKPIDSFVNFIKGDEK
jgi:hypothetical protein